MIELLRTIQDRLSRLERSLQRPTQEIRDGGDLRLRLGRQPDDTWTVRAHDAAGDPCGDLVQADPVGRVVHLAVGPVPDGWLLCNGQKVTTAYPVLRQRLLAASSPWGVDGADPRVPNLTTKFLRGNTTVGGTGGADTVTLTVAQLPPHGHDIDVGHGGNAANAARVSGNNTGGAGVTTATWGTPINDTGGGQAHENRPPYVDLLPVIRAY